MTAVPKLNYANLRGKSKSKDSEHSQQKIENTSTDLFSHMNQDNLKYIQNQIKQKNRKTSLIKKQSHEIEYEHEYPSKIEEQSSHQESGRDYDNQEIRPTVIVMKTEGERESIKLTDQNQFEETKKQSEGGETNKLSYYDLVSQAKSKRVTSLEVDYDEEDQEGKSKEKGGFLNFLSSYIEDLNIKENQKKQQKEKKPAKSRVKHQSELSRQKSKLNSIMISSRVSHKQAIKTCLAEQKLKSMCLAKQLQQHKHSEQTTNSRIDMLQKYVLKLDEQLQSLKISVGISQQSKPKPHNENFNIYQHHQNGHLSHRKNNTAFSLASNSRVNRTREVERELTELERQYEMFRETGECRVFGAHHSRHYD